MTPTTSETAPARRHKVYTLILPLDIKKRRVLLGYKRRGFGIHKYNGFGGKVEPGETVAEGALRELEEEACIRCKPDALKHHAILLMETLADFTQPVLEIHVFVALDWEGQPQETEEMTPKWFSPFAMPDESELEPLPLNSMWEETRGWMPVLLGLYFPSSIIRKRVDEERLEIEEAMKGRKDDQRFFAHYFAFQGGLNPQTGKCDAWHGMAGSRFEWFSTELGEWPDDSIRKWVESARKELAR